MKSQENDLTTKYKMSKVSKKLKHNQVINHLYSSLMNPMNMILPMGGDDSPPPSSHPMTPLPPT